MKTSILLWGALGAALLAGGVLAYSQLRVTPTDENVVAKRLAGSWSLNAEWTRKLDRDMNPIIKALKFTPDSNVLVKMKAISSRYQDKDIFSAGFVSIDGGPQYPYITTVANGNPQVIWWTPLGGDWLGVPNVRTVWVAIARDTSNDLLLWGGDHTWDVSAIYNRASP